MTRSSSSTAEFLNGRVVLHAGDCIEVMTQMDPDSVDAVVCDPPYHLTSIVKRFGAEGSAAAKEGQTGAFKRAGFMGKQWDGGDVAFQAETWAKVLRVLKPGGYLLAFASSRGFGRMSVAIEDAGFVVHPLIAWVFGTGFPKATRVKADGYDDFRYGGQALKPAIEPIFMGQKPFEHGLNGTENILKHGTGAVNIGGCRVPSNGETPKGSGRKLLSYAGQNHRPHHDREPALGNATPAAGRWPANLIHDGSAEVLQPFPDTKSGMFEPHHNSCGASGIGTFDIRDRTGETHPTYGESGSASRFFYQAKADATDRLGSKHPTVKPLDLMQYLVRLVTPHGGTVLDPFAGTGTTGEAAWREGFNAVLIEREPEYQADIANRMKLAERPTERAAVAKDKGKLSGAEGTPLFGWGAPDGQFVIP